MKVAVTGSHGLLGTALRDALEREGHEVVPVVRSDPRSDQVGWDELAELEGCDAVVNLAGAPIFGRRWNAAHKKAILESREEGTTKLSGALAAMADPPKVLLSGSAIGYYGNRGDEELTESSSPGSDYLAEVCRRWEAATRPATDAGIRTVLLRTGIVQSAQGGSLKAQLPLFKLGLGGRLGKGSGWISWIALDDHVGAMLHALGEPALTGPVNLVAPNPVTNRSYTMALAGLLKRPAFLPVPAAALHLALGAEMADELPLASQRVKPEALRKSGFKFRYPDLEAALRHVLGRPAA
ncbi:MAG: TIGR01777 family oxidoreductase [Acidimicrobiales bacterium]